MARPTIGYRPRNRCRSCHIIWRPKGKIVSTSCPKCGSWNVQLHPVSRIVLAVPLVVVLGAVCFLVLRFLK